MDLRTPRDFDGPAAPLMRPTDRARRALRRAAVLLGTLAAAAAVSVGMAAGGSTGTAAGMVTLLVCWIVLVLGVAWWDRRLSDLDLQRWAADWARVEPEWSGRR